MNLNKLEKICDEWDNRIPSIVDSLPDFPVRPAKRWKTLDYIWYSIDLSRFLGLDNLYFDGVDTYRETGGYYIEKLKEIRVLYPITKGVSKDNLHWTMPHELAHHMLSEFGCYNHSHPDCNNHLHPKKMFDKFELYAYFIHRSEIAARILAPHISQKYYPHSRYSMGQLKKYDLDTEHFYIDIAYEYYCMI